MVCSVEQNSFLRPARGISGAIPFCAATLAGLFIGDNMKKIPLTQGKFTLVDDEDFERASNYKWFRDRATYTSYATRNIGTRPNKSKQRMHRLIMQAKKGQQIDHINGNGLDNRRCNLRFCTNSQNQMNARPMGGSSKYKGVSWNKKGNKWYSAIRFNYKQIHLGVFVSETLAAKAYDSKAKELFGEFAYLNFPDSRMSQ